MGPHIQLFSSVTRKYILRGIPPFPVAGHFDTRSIRRYYIRSSLYSTYTYINDISGSITTVYFKNCYILYRIFHSATLWVERCGLFVYAKDSLHLEQKTIELHSGQPYSAGLEQQMEHSPSATQEKCLQCIIECVSNLHLLSVE